MICRHTKGDVSCSSHPEYRDPSYYEPKFSSARAAENSPDKTKFEIEEVEEVGPHLVMKVKYPNCSKCSYEGLKIMVFLHIPLKAVFKWKEIDPHFRDEKAMANSNKAPSPAARFPASKDGWDDAMKYAWSKTSTVRPTLGNLRSPDNLKEENRICQR